MVREGLLALLICVNFLLSFLPVETGHRRTGQVDCSEDGDWRHPGAQHAPQKTFRRTSLQPGAAIVRPEGAAEGLDLSESSPWAVGCVANF